MSYKVEQMGCLRQEMLQLHGLKYINNNNNSKNTNTNASPTSQPTIQAFFTNTNIPFVNTHFEICGLYLDEKQCFFFLLFANNYVVVLPLLLLVLDGHCCCSRCSGDIIVVVIVSNFNK